MFTPHFFKSCVSGLALSLLMSACASAPLMPVAQDSTALSTKVSQKPIKLNYKKDQRLTLITLDSKAGEDAEQAVAQYYKTVFPVAEKNGLTRDAQLRVAAVAQGQHKAEGLIFFSWPDAQSEQAFQDAMEWDRVKALRQAGWDELRLYSTTLSEDLNLTFAPEKTYSLAVAWKNPKNPDDYDQYMDNIKEGVRELGGRFIYKMFDPTFESHALTAEAPYQLTFVEWDTADGLQKFGQSDTFKENAKLISSGVTRFELMLLKVS